MSGLGIERAIIQKFINLLVDSDICVSRAVFPCMSKAICIWFGFTLTAQSNLHLFINFSSNYDLLMFSSGVL